MDTFLRTGTALAAATAAGLGVLGGACATAASAQTVVDTPHNSVVASDDLPVAGGTTAVAHSLGVPFTLSDGTAGTAGEFLP